MNTRIKELRKSLNLTQEEFSSAIGLSRNFIAQVESGAKVPSDRTVKDICREYGVNEDWLRTGNGEMKKNRTKNQEIQEFMNDVMEDVDESFRKRFICALSKLNVSDWETLAKIIKELTKED